MTDVAASRELDPYAWINTEVSGGEPGHEATTFHDVLVPGDQAFDEYYRTIHRLRYVPDWAIRAVAAAVFGGEENLVELEARLVGAGDIACQLRLLKTLTPTQIAHLVGYKEYLSGGSLRQGGRTP